MRAFVLALLLAVSASAASISLTWSPNPTLIEDGVNGYLLQHSGEDGVFTNLVLYSSTTTACTVTNFNVGKHYFRLRCTSPYGISEGFAVAATNLTWTPNSPATLIVNKISSNSVTVTFQLAPP